jgi:starch synthase
VRGRESLNILLLSAEVAPFAKVGGLADVAGSLPKALGRLGHDVRVIMPRYGCIDLDRFDLRYLETSFTLVVGPDVVEVRVMEGRIDGVPIYFVDIPALFGDRQSIYGDDDDGRRFLLFCAAALQVPEELQWRPAIVHCNDWHTAIVPAMLRKGFRSFMRDAASIFTIHNLAYQGSVERWSLGGAGALLPDDLHDHWVNIMALGVQWTDILTTVSPTYAREIMLPECGAGLDGLIRTREERLFGILNGIDTDVYNPATDPKIAANYDWPNLSGKVACKSALQRMADLPEDANVPMLGSVGRLVEQKGCDLLVAALESLLQATPIQFVILGAGTSTYTSLLREMERRYPERLRAWLSFGATEPEYIYAGVDMFVMPSRFEPCGLGQLIAMRYGTVPIVRATGGLLDTVREGPPSDPRTGFVFEAYTPDAFVAATHRALEAYRQPHQWRTLIRNGMCADLTWESSALAYVDLYRQAIALRST